MKTYRFIYEDAQGNDLETKNYEFENITEARKHAQKLFAVCMYNDCVKIRVKKI